MITLHNTTEETKLILKWGGILIGTILIFLIFFRLGKNLKEFLYPTPPPPPTVSFGKLPKIIFPKNTNDKNFSYTLDTLSGTLPAFSDRTNVYPILHPKPNLLSSKRALEKAEKIGFNTQGKPLSETLYEWNDELLLSRKFVIDTISSNFSYSSDLFSDKQILKNPESKEKSIELARAFLESLSAFPSDIDESKTKTMLLAIKDKNLVAATSFSNAQVIRVDFFQKDKDNFPIFYPNPPFSTMHVVVGGKAENQILSANFYHYDIDSTSATYPIKTGDEAFEELKSGKAYIASYYGEKNEILIKKVFLGYYMGLMIQDYLMPIFIFEGNDGFFAYVSLVKEEWISN